ncbi:beta-2-glycoprotein 1 isoform X2 [Salmo salar]|uniref:Beta-2-glycoprotein 1 n=1 Tax=Salmo salar TaxID=8030 RepID=A0ABM3CKZ4_SALSA|nr:beta-2-glycoprotein 1-like isoform X2 [Salmo salar]
MNPNLALLLLCQLALYTSVTSKNVCGHPPVTDGMDTLGLKHVYEIGKEVTLACERGYTPVKAKTASITCSASGEWTKLDLVCSPKMCPLPKPMQKPGMIDVPFKSVLNYTCDDGYVMIGANESVCLHDGTLSAPPPMCKAVSCALPQAPKHGKIVYDNKKFTGDEIQYGQSWTYECLPPRAPIGNERGSCLASGNVTEPPVCKAPCKVNINRGRIFYNAKKIWIGDLKPNRILHGESVVFYCLNKELKCGSPVASQCIDGTLNTPECFKEPGKMEYTLKPKSLPSEIAMCPTDLTK